MIAVMTPFKKNHHPIHLHNQSLNFNLVKGMNEPDSAEASKCCPGDNFPLSPTVIFALNIVYLHTSPPTKPNQNQNQKQNENNH